MTTARSSDDGLSFIELIIYVVVLGLIAIGISVMLSNMWSAQSAVGAQSRATADGQLVGSEIERAMRNAVGYQVADGGSTLLVQTVLTGSNQCVAFHFDPTYQPAGETNPVGSLQMVVHAAPAPAAATGPIWQKGIAQQGSAFFTDVAVPRLGGGVGYKFSASVPSGRIHIAAVPFTGSAYMRVATNGGTSTCWP